MMKVSLLRQRTIQELAAQRAEEEAQNAEENGTDTTDTEDANGTDTANNLQNGETGGNADPAAAAAGQNETDDGLGNGFDENGNPLPNTGLDTDLGCQRYFRHRSARSFRPQEKGSGSERYLYHE